MWNIMQTEWRKLRRCQILPAGIVLQPSAR